MPTPRLFPAATLAAAALSVLTGCASVPVAGAGAASATPALSAAAAKSAATPASAAPRPAAAASAPGAAPPAPGQPPPFATLIKDTKKIDGLFSAWQKDEKVWLELQPADFNRPFFLSPKLVSGIGEQMVYGGLMARGGPRLVEFRRVYNQVQLIALNPDQIAAAGTPESRAVAVASSVSLLGSTPVASGPHPERKSVLVDAGALFVTDLLALAPHLQRSYRQGYAFDARNSAITQVRGKPELLVLEVNSHFAAPTIQVAQPGLPPGMPPPSTPASLPDARSLFVKLHYSLAKLPEVAMAGRRADARVGYFTEETDDYTGDLARTPRQRWLKRWRLEKKDPAAELSEPVKPITFWLDRNIPLAYRQTVSEGVLAWNAAFERIGFRNAIVVQQQSDDADFDTLDADVASIRWMVNRAPQFGAIGPSHADPRSGEILDADIGIESILGRDARTLRARLLGGDARSTAGAAGLGFATAAGAPWADSAELAQLMQIGGPPADAAAAAESCTYSAQVAEQLGYALDLLQARGELDPDSPEVRQFALDSLRETTMHEVGHTLGLRHNFRASHAFADRRVTDAAYTRSQPFIGSVMEYAPVNLAGPGRPPVAPFQGRLGPYDLWAIEYGYKTFPPGTSAADENAELARIAARSAEPELAYGTDEDSALGIDPEALMFDLGDDPLAFAARRFDIMAELFRRQESRRLKPDEDFSALRRSLGYALRDAARATGIVLRQIGGLRTLRDHPGSGRDPLQPVPAAQQRAALDLLAGRLLAADAFTVSPALQRRLAPDYQERGETPTMVTEFALAQSVLDMQRALLTRLMSDALAQRLLDNVARVDAPAQAQALKPAELYARLDAAIYSDLAGHGDIPAPRRELQRDHISRLAALVLKPQALARADARAQVRAQAQSLAARLQRAAQRAGLSNEARLHLADGAEALRSALAARSDRQPG